MNNKVDLVITLLKESYPLWYKLMNIKLLKEILTKIQEYDDLCPLWEDIFNWVKVSPDNVVAIIIGQAPYHSNIKYSKAVMKKYKIPVNENQTKRYANGTCFSYNGYKQVPGLRNIVKSLINCKVVNAKSYKNFEHGDLTKWEDQGILLLNMSLTTRLGKKDAHKKLWKPFIIELLTNFNKKYKVPYMLWGNNAKSLKEENCGIKTVFEWCHPSMYGIMSFDNCDNFVKLNEYLVKQGKKEINWDYR